jgi:hypothetical protein
VSRAQVGFFSLSGSLGEAADRDYLAWHQLDHMPEQYRLTGMLHGQRWLSTPRCRAERLVGVGDWATVDHVVLYLMGEPVESTLDDFMRLGATLRRAGRYPVALPSVFAGATGITSTAAAPPALVGAEVVPWRPNRGVFVMVEEADGGTRKPGGHRAFDSGRAGAHGDEGLLAIPGVAGVWRFGTDDRYRRWQRVPGDFVFTVVYLDDDPASLAPSVGSALIGPGEGAEGVLMAAPFEALVPWVWQATSDALAGTFASGPAPGKGLNLGDGPTSSATAGSGPRPS